MVAAIAVHVPLIAEPIGATRGSIVLFPFLYVSPYRAKALVRTVPGT